MSIEEPHPTFADGLSRIAKALAGKGLDLADRIVTSRDPGIAELRDTLKVSKAPQGFHKWQLPVHVGSATQMFITVGEPNAKVPTHNHEDGDVFRVIISGSLIYRGVEYTAGDWMFIPAGKPYEYVVGPAGVSNCCCYACCCVGNSRRAFV